MSSIPVILDFAPGIQRDNTPFDAKRCLDALWTRWRDSRPRKMGGTLRLTDGLLGIPRRIHMFYVGQQVYIHVGTSNGLQQVVTDQFGNVISTANRTPAQFSPSIYNDWTLDAIFDTTSTYVNLVAHCTTNALSIANVVQTTPYIGSIVGNTALVQFSQPAALDGGTYTLPSIAGGIVCVQPFVFDFDAYGLVQWSGPNLPQLLGTTGGTSQAGQARISAQKIVTGAPLRGGGTQQPAVLFWSLSEVIGGVYVGSSAYFAFSTISDNSSILSAKAVIEYDSIYYWPGVDRFLMYNGTVQEVPNLQNQDWFFNNLTPGYQQKAFAYKVPRYGEIWFCAPMFGNTEPSHAVILNVREGYWYDTALPDGGRSAGFYAQGFPFPVMAGVAPDANGYKLWKHEIGVDEVDGKTVNPLRSYFETPYLGNPKNQQASDDGSSVGTYEPDFIMTGDMFCYLITSPNARAQEVAGQQLPIKFIPTVPQEQGVGFKSTSRLFRMHIESNVVGGNYIFGRNLLHVDPTADARIFG